MNHILSPKTSDEIFERLKDENTRAYPMTKLDNILLYFCEHDKPKAFKRVYEQNKDRMHINQTLFSLIFRASPYNCVEILKFIKKKLNIKSFEDNDLFRRSSCIAAAHGNLENVKFFAKNKADVSTLLLSCMIGQLKENTFRPTVTNAMIYAAVNGHFEVVKYLVENTKENANLHLIREYYPLILSKIMLINPEIGEYLWEYSNQNQKRKLID